MTIDELIQHIKESNLPDGYEFSVWEHRSFCREDRKLTWPHRTELTLLVWKDDPRNDSVVHASGPDTRALVAAFNAWMDSRETRPLIQNPDFATCEL